MTAESARAALAAARDAKEIAARASLIGEAITNTLKLKFERGVSTREAIQACSMYGRGLAKVLYYSSREFSKAFPRFPGESILSLLF